MGKTNDFIIQFTIFLVGLIAISIGRILYLVSNNIVDLFFSWGLVLSGIFILSVLLFTIYFTWRRESAQQNKV